MQDLVITPNRGTSNNPTISFTGQNTGSISLNVLPAGNLNFAGNAGTLLNITDSSTFSVSTSGAIVTPGGSSNQWNQAYTYLTYLTANSGTGGSLSNYLPLSGGTIFGNLTVNGTIYDGSNTAFYLKPSSVSNLNTLNITANQNSINPKLFVSDYEQNITSNYVANSLQYISANTASNPATHTALSVGISGFYGYSLAGAIGVQSSVTESWGSMANAYAFNSQLGVTLNYQNIANAYNYYAASPLAVTNSSITSAYGLFINPQKVANINTGYGVYQLGSSDINYFQGSVGIGTATPSTPLQVNTAGYVLNTNAYTLDMSVGAGGGGWARSLRLYNSSSPSTQTYYFGATNTYAYMSTGDPTVIDPTGYNATKILTLTLSGYVGVGTTSPKTTVHIAGALNSNSPTAGAATSAGLFVANSDPGYGLLIGTGSNGSTWIQNQRVDGSATYYNINIQPNGGAVGIGTTLPRSLLDVTRVDPQITLHNVNDTVGGFIQQTYGQLKLGMYNPSGSTYGAIAANTQMSMLGMNSNGAVYTSNTTGGNPSAYNDGVRNYLDDGSGNMYVAGTIYDYANTGYYLKASGASVHNQLYLNNQRALILNNSNPGNNYITASANGPAINLHPNGGSGGVANRWGALTWVDNGGNYGGNIWQWDESGYTYSTGNGRTTYGPNTSWNQYLQIGGNGIDGSYAQIAASSGNLHIESLNGSYGTYINYYRAGAIYLWGATYTNSTIYDYANTNYYVKPSNISVFNSLQTNGLYISNGNVTISQTQSNVYTSGGSLLNTSYVAQIQSATSGQIGVRLVDTVANNINYVSGDVPMPYGYSVTGYGEHNGWLSVPQSLSYPINLDMVFYAGNDGSNTFRFKPYTWDGSNNHLGSDAFAIGAFTGHTYTYGVMYDGANTGYYIKPSSTSNIYALTVASYGSTTVGGQQVAAGTAGYQALNFDTIKQPGLYQYDGGISGTKPPDPAPYNFRTIEIGNANRYTQLAFGWTSGSSSYTTGYGLIWNRYQVDGTWQNWQSVNTTAQGIDAYYQPYNYVHGYMSTSGVGSSNNGDSINDFNSSAFTSVCSIGSILGNSNTPFGGGTWYNLINTRHRGGASDGYAWGGQIAMGMTGYLNRMAFRNMYSTTWQSWNEVVTYNNNVNSGAIYSDSFYSSSNTGYYLRPSGQSNVYQMGAWQYQWTNNTQGYAWLANTPDTAMMTGGSPVLGDGVYADLLAFNTPSLQEYQTGGNGSYSSGTWTSKAINMNWFTGRQAMNYGGSGESFSPGGVTGMRWTWNNFGYQWWDALSLSDSSNGGYIAITVEFSTNGSSWTVALSNYNWGVTWPGYHFLRWQTNNAGNNPYLRITLTAVSFYNNVNGMSFGCLSMYGSYSSYNPLFTWDSSRNLYSVGNLTAYYSDERLKTKKGNITQALEKVKKLNGFYYEANDTAVELGYKKKPEIGVSAQEVEAVLPELIQTAPISEKAKVDYKTIDYGRLVPLLIEAIKELTNKVDTLEGMKKAEKID